MLNVVVELTTSKPTTKALLKALALQHPDAHPYTLALLLSVQTGRAITGDQAAKLLGKT